MPARLTFGQIAEGGGVRDDVSRVTRDLIRRSNEAAAADARVHLYVISCDSCAAAKACCACVVTAYLYEAIPIAARLVRARRDTPALRMRLRDAAERMEAVGADGHVGPCVFLDAAERCTIYDDRPAVCGAHLVSSPAEHCARPGGEVTAIAAPLLEAVQPETAEVVAEALGLEPIDAPYFGALPRMVLLCLEAWARPDYARFLGEHGRAAAAAIAVMAARTSR